MIVSAMYIGEASYDSLPTETARNFKYCPKCDMFYNTIHFQSCPCGRVKSDADLLYEALNKINS